MSNPEVVVGVVDSPSSVAEIKPGTEVLPLATGAAVKTITNRRTVAAAVSGKPDRATARIRQAKEPQIVAGVITDLLGALTTRTDVESFLSDAEPGTRNAWATRARERIARLEPQLVPLLARRLFFNMATESDSFRLPTYTLLLTTTLNMSSFMPDAPPVNPDHLLHSYVAAIKLPPEDQNPTNVEALLDAGIAIAHYFPLRQKTIFDIEEACEAVIVPMQLGSSRSILNQKLERLKGSLIKTIVADFVSQREGGQKIRDSVTESATEVLERLLENPYLNNRELAASINEDRRVQIDRGETKALTVNDINHLRALLRARRYLEKAKSGRKPLPESRQVRVALIHGDPRTAGTASDIAEVFDATKTSVDTARRSRSGLGLGIRPQRGDEEREGLEAYIQGNYLSLTDEQLGEPFGLGAEAISKRRRALGLLRPPSGGRRRQTP